MNDYLEYYQLHVSNSEALEVEPMNYDDFVADIEAQDSLGFADEPDEWNAGTF